MWGGWKKKKREKAKKVLAVVLFWFDSCFLIIGFYFFYFNLVREKKLTFFSSYWVIQILRQKNRSMVRTSEVWLNQKMGLRFLTFPTRITHITHPPIKMWPSKSVIVNFFITNFGYTVRSEHNLSRVENFHT